ncbi:TPA: hypothetical protein ACW72O_002797 [Elizabethkingia anophelis]|uniref:hypothetical protein n=1 Tax=Elizabethkingia anophelis TaxID=1117645 RepID=UPI0013DD89E2|nr:hypothetical protein [Elizabethkingia anophelis]MCL1690570.1 hypothetical protein [Elizabethkingia anophelis]
MIKDEKKINERKDYFPPTLIVELIEMEQGIAAGSAQVKPNQPDEEWQTEEQTGNLDW